MQDAAYGTLLREPRRALHARIAEVLRDRFTTIADAEPEVVAHHFTQAALAEAGIEWWSKAGERALRSSAYEEAIAHLEQALVLAGALAESPAQRLLRLRLQIAYGQALIHARGFAAPETAAAFSRAREFASGVEDVTERFPVYYGLWAGSWVRGEFAQMRELALTFPDDTKTGRARGRLASHTAYLAQYVGFRETLLERACTWKIRSRFTTVSATATSPSGSVKTPAFPP